jgi:hypothetical protein
MPSRPMMCAVVAVLLLSSVSILGRSTPAAAAAERCFPETGKCVSGAFYDYWLANGGLAQQGVPLTSEFDEPNPTDGKIYRVQYFERARFEYHPENQPPYNVLLGLLGREQYRVKYLTAPTPLSIPFPDTGNLADRNCDRFNETGKYVCGPFLAYWQRNGGLAQQGLPLIDTFEEVSPTDGKTYRVQYFERARFEYHPENKGTAYVVLLGLLGREQFLAKYPGGQAPVSVGLPPSAPNTCPSSHPIKGNRSSSGEKIYHVPGGQFYDRTDPERCFATEADAQANGYRRSER